MDEFPTIRDMFLGKRGQDDRVTLTATYRKLQDVAVKEEAAFLDLISKYPEIYKAYKKHYDAELALLMESEFNFYAEGFRFGLLLGTEAAKS